MASVAWKKLHTGTEVAAVLQHCDAKERLVHTHSNKDIQTALTGQNESLYDISYRDALKKYQDRLAFIDGLGNTNRRKDRVTMIALNIPIPEGIESSEFFRQTSEIVRNFFGDSNLVQGYLHRDEKHEYIDRSGTRRTSLDHIHYFVVPERDFRLQAKRIESRANLKKLNRLVDDMCLKIFKQPFMKYRTPEELLEHQSAFGETVESLKSQSRARSIRDALEKSYRAELHDRITHANLEELEEMSRKLGGERQKETPTPRKSLGLHL